MNQDGDVVLTETIDGQPWRWPWSWVRLGISGAFSSLYLSRELEKRESAEAIEEQRAALEAAIQCLPGFRYPFTCPYDEQQCEAPRCYLAEPESECAKASLRRNAKETPMQRELKYILERHGSYWRLRKVGNRYGTACSSSIQTLLDVAKRRRWEVIDHHHKS